MFADLPAMWGKNGGKDARKECWEIIVNRGGRGAA